MRKSGNKEYLPDKTEEIRNFMTEHRIYQWELAGAIGISESTLSRWLRCLTKEQYLLCTKGMGKLMKEREENA